MSVLEVLTAENPILRRKSRRVKAFDGDLQRLANDMLETMHAASGLGLAAPQVGNLKRLIIIEMPEDEEDPNSGKRFVLVNPEIVRSEGEEEGEEGCLSIPGYVGLVRRAAQVTVRAQTVKGKRVRLEGEGLLARALQHEVDHLNGILYIDRVEKPEDIRALAPEERWDRVPEKEGQAPAKGTVAI